MTDQEKQATQLNTITKSTNITLGLVASCLMAIIGGIGGGAWWAATMTSDMGQVQKDVAEVRVTMSDNVRRITVLEAAAVRKEHLQELVKSLVQEMRDAGAFGHE